MDSNRDILEVKNLSVSFRTDFEFVQAVEDVSFTLREGEILGLVGESGSGKTVTGMSILRLIPRPPGRFESGEVLYRDQDLLTLPLEELRKVRGGEIGVIFQEPMTALSPLHPVGRQLAEALRFHRDLSKREAWELGASWLDKVGIPQPETRMHAYPFQLSGGMRQRVMIAMAMMLEPRILIADEPTTALDVTTQAQIFDLIMEMKAEQSSLLFITHDMGVIWELCDRLLVMKDARLVEQGDLEAVFSEPQEAYTQELLSSVPRLTDEPRTPSEFGTGPPVLEIEGLHTWFPIKRGVFAHTVGHVKAVDGVSLVVRRGETYAVVGESGSGKTTLGRTILGLDYAREGLIRFDGENLFGLSRKQFLPFRKYLQIVFQDPFSSLNPRMTVLDILTEGLRVHQLLDGSAEDEAVRLLDEVGMPPEQVHRYPHEFSGGQRQRICIARALSLKPKFIVCDEAVSALDVTIQAQVIELLMELQERHHLSYLFITHDLSVVSRIADRIAVMRHGRIIEEGEAARVIREPEHEYTRNLLAAVPVPGGMRRRTSPPGAQDNRRG